MTTTLKKKKVEMYYCNYEGKIVEKYGVQLKGWPSSKSGICNPATLGGHQHLEKLLAALESGQCHWVVLSEDELEERKRYNQAHEERGKQVYQPRKSTNHQKAAKSAETIENEEDEEDEEDEETNEPTSKRARDDNDESDQEHSAKRSRIDNAVDSGDDQENTDNPVIGDDQHNTDNTAMGNDQHGDNTDIVAIGDDQHNTDITQELATTAI